MSAAGWLERPAIVQALRIKVATDIKYYEPSYRASPASQGWG